MNAKPLCFKAYDARGKVPEDLNPQLCAALGQALAAEHSPGTVAIGRDNRLSSPQLEEALAAALLAQGVNVDLLGICGTEELYFAVARGDYDLGVMITGSHIPADMNGFKFVQRGAAPIGKNSGLPAIAARTAEFLENPAQAAENSGKKQSVSIRSDYIDWLIDYAGFADSAAFLGRRLRAVIDCGNGCAGPLLQELAKRLPVAIGLINFEPDGNFPNGIPNPLLPANREAASRAVIENGADIGVAFDGDFDRCFFFDHKGRFVESCYLVGLLASELLEAHPGETIAHDPRVYWNTRDLIMALGGMPALSPGGHTHMKETMRRENAIYGGELSGHHFYRDFNYCDSGMLTMLLMFSLLLRSGQTLAELVEAGIASYPCSGEVNFQVKDADKTLDQVWQRYKREAIASDRVDGISIEYPGWRFNLRASNTEPLLRLNIESRGDPELVKKKLAELSRFINA